MQILLDTLSSTMMLIVSGVGGLIVWYSMGYMEGDDEERRYFAYMSLFVFSMLMLVQAGNFLLLLVGWGLVGLASYLLIGFWHHKPEAVAAAKKAFVMNAIGDATFALGARAAHLGDRHARVRRRLRRGRLAVVDDREPRRSRPARRRGREVGADPAPHVASRTRWRARRRSPLSSTRRRWSPPASTCSCGRARSSRRRPTCSTSPRSSARSRSSSPASSRSSSGTSSASSRTRRCRRSATCSSRPGSARTATRSST